MPHDDKAAVKKVAKPNKELGVSGTKLVDGIILDRDYNYKLIGLSGLETYEQMSSGDATVGAALDAVKLPIMGADWSIEAASEDPLDVEVAEFAHAALFDYMSESWTEVLGDILEYLDYGFSVMEVVYKQLDDGKIVWKKIAPRIQKSIFSWETADKQPGVQQLDPLGTTVSIPIEKLIIFTNRKRGDNWEGQSLLRRAYKHWFIKDKVYKIDAIAQERQGVGIPTFQYERSPTDTEKAEIRAILKNIRANEQAYAEWPKSLGTLEMLGMNAAGNRNPEFTINHHDGQIVKSVLAPFINLGSTGTGSFALSKEQVGFFLMGVSAIADYVKDTFNHYAIRRLVDLNYNVKAYPKLTYSKLDERDPDSFALALERLVKTGVIQPDETLETFIRSEMRLPEKDEQTDRNPEAKLTELKKEVDDALLDF